MKTISYIAGIILILITTLFSFDSCKKNEDSPHQTDIQFLGHKGGGTTAYSLITIENTIPAIQEGLKNLDGVEDDIQMSLDGTLWLFHNFDFEDVLCDTGIHSSIPLLNDLQINQLRYCSYGLQDRFYKLSELFDLLNSSSGGFPISLEVKRSFSQKVFDSIGGRDKYLYKLADTLGYMISKVKYPDRIYIESDFVPFFDRLKKRYTNANCFLMNLEGNPDYTTSITKAHINNYAGISCSFDNPTYTSVNMKIAKDLGLKVMVWTPNTQEELLHAYNIGPDIIQTDNMQAKKDLNVE